MRDYLLSEWGIPILLVTLANVVSFSVTFGFLMPVQDGLFPAFGNYASLLYLPHGVRVISAWLYGWRSLILLTPGAILTHGYLYGLTGFSLDYTFAMLIGVFCAAISFWFLAQIGMDFRTGKTHRVNWRHVMLAGVAASVLNAFGTTFFFGNDMITTSARFVGDVSGMFACFFILMLIFRALRRSGKWPNPV